MLKRVLPGWVRSVARVALRADDRWNLLHEWERRLLGEPALPPGSLGRVLVICHGNICRSPFAGHLLAARAPQLEVRSAGLEAQEGDPAEPAARRVAPHFRLDLDDHRSHRMNRADVEWADLILGMQGHHGVAVARRWPDARSKVHLLGDCLDAAPYAIEDPWGCDDAFFRSTFERIERAVERLIGRMESSEARTLTPAIRTEKPA